jgi:hypothetical protein
LFLVSSALARSIGSFTAMSDAIRVISCAFLSLVLDKPRTTPRTWFKTAVFPLLSYSVLSSPSPKLYVGVIPLDYICPGRSIAGASPASPSHSLIRPIEPDGVTTTSPQLNKSRDIERPNLGGRRRLNQAGSTCLYALPHRHSRLRWPKSCTGSPASKGRPSKIGLAGSYISYLSPVRRTRSRIPGSIQHQLLMVSERGELRHL